MSKLHPIMLTVASLLIAVAAWFPSHAQCGEEVLCADSEPTSVLMDTPNAAAWPCLNMVGFAQVFEFTTNNSMNDDDANIVISNVVYPDTLLGQIQAVVLTPNSANPCNTGIASQFGPCAADTVGIEFDLNGLQSNTTYFLVIGSNTDSISFDVNIDGSALDINACCDEVIQQGLDYTVESVEGGDNYQWEPVDVVGEDQFELDLPTFKPEESMTLTVTGQVGECLVTDEIFLEVVPALQPPNAFTPNGDGDNDLWLIPGIDLFETARVSVYDRWGQLVFKSIGYAAPWDGTNRGKRLPTGAYYYVIEIRSLEIDVDPILGTISIIH